MFILYTCNVIRERFRSKIISINLRSTFIIAPKFFYHGMPLIVLILLYLLGNITNVNNNISRKMPRNSSKIARWQVFSSLVKFLCYNIRKQKRQINTMIKIIFTFHSELPRCPLESKPAEIRTADEFESIFCREIPPSYFSLSPRQILQLRLFFSREGPTQLIARPRAIFLARGKLSFLEVLTRRGL